MQVSDLSFKLVYLYVYIFNDFQLKAVVIDENYAVLQEASVEFDVDLPEFR